MLVMGLTLSGCNTPAERPGEPNVNLAGFPPSFKEGYLDGCASARSAAGTTKDEQRFRSDASYAQGWRDGQDVCGRN